MILGLTDTDLWSDDEPEKGHTREDNCGRGPWCGRGPLRLPSKPLERMSNIQQTYEPDGMDSQRSSLVHRLSAVPRASLQSKPAETPRPSTGLAVGETPRPSAIPRRLTGALKTVGNMFLLDLVLFIFLVAAKLL